MKLPQARTKNLVEQNLTNETLIYDLITNKAFNLNETSSIVYKACDGKTTFDELKRRHKFGDEFIYLALDELKRNDLLAENAAYVSPFAETSRRALIKKVGLASMFALPLIAGLVAPTAARAASNTAGGGEDIRSDVRYGEYCDESSGGHTRICDHYSSLTCRGNICCDAGSLSNLPTGSTLPYTAIFSVELETSCQQTGQAQNCCSGILNGNCTSTAIEDEGGNVGYLIECNVGDCTCG